MLGSVLLLIIVIILVLLFKNKNHPIEAPIEVPKIVEKQVQKEQFSPSKIENMIKKANVLFPAHSTFAMLQPDKLLLHFPAAAGAYFVAGSHPCHRSFFYCRWKKYITSEWDRHP